MEDLSKMSDEYLFDDFRGLFTKGREFGLSGDDRKMFQGLCAEMGKRGWLKRKYGMSEQCPRSLVGSKHCPPKAKIVRSSRTAGTKRKGVHSGKKKGNIEVLV